MSQRTIVVMHVSLIRRPGRNRKDIWDSRSRDEDWEYQVWIVTEIRLAGPEEIDVGSILQATRAAADAENSGERFTEALAKSAADNIEGEIWRVWQTSDDLPLDQTINFLIGVSESVHEVVQNSLECLADGIGVPAPVDLVGANVVATLLTDPITEPIGNVEHGLELAGILVGLATGVHPLVMTCAKYLIHDEISSALSEGIKDALESVFKNLEKTFIPEFSTLPASPVISDRTIALFEEAQCLWEPWNNSVDPDESTVDSQNVIVNPVDTISPLDEI